MKRDEALDKLRKVTEAHSRTRHYDDSYWTLAVLYDSGRQWGYQTTRFGRLMLRHLRNIIDPRRQDVRVTMNLIHRDVRLLEAGLQPRRLSFHCKAADGSSGSGIVANTCEQFLHRWLPRIRALDVLREKERGRGVLGSMCVRRTIAERGVMGDLAKAGGNGSSGPRNLKVGWAKCYPWQFIRDPAICELPGQSQDEEILAQHQPRSLGWVKRHFGVDLTGKTEATLGRLQEYERQIFSARSEAAQSRMPESQIRGVMIYEAYLKDPDVDDDLPEWLRWPWLLFGWCDPVGQERKIEPLGWGRNPFYGLPFHWFHYDKAIRGRWGRGIPHIQMAGQDIVNIAWSWLLRLMQAGAGQIVLEKGTVEEPAEAITNRVDRVIEWERSPQYAQLQQPPQRLAPPQLNQAGMELINRAPVWMSEAINISPVQRGEAVTRGEAGKAYEIRLSEASQPLDQLRVSDRLVIGELLMGTLVDATGKPFLRLDQAREVLGPDVPDDHIRAMVRNPVHRSISAVAVHPTTTNPKTPSESQDEIVALANAQIFENEAAMTELMLRGIDVSTPMARNYRKQNAEIERMTHEAEVLPPAMADNHGYHMAAIELFAGGPGWESLDPEAQQRIMEHYARHLHAAQQRAQAEMMMTAQQGGGPGMASPPAEAAQAAQNMEMGAAAPMTEVA